MGRFDLFPIFIATFALTQKRYLKKANLRNAMKSASWQIVTH